jgi:hypothetical protein
MVLDHVIILSERHLRRVLSSYFHYHHNATSYSYAPRAITSLTWAGYIIAMTAEPREIAGGPALNLIFEQGQVERVAGSHIGRKAELSCARRMPAICFLESI